MAHPLPNALDSLISEFDAGLRTVTACPGPGDRDHPGAGHDDAPLSAAERSLAARLMRVNHSGEIAAQALYRGQALMTSDHQLRGELLKAAREEQDHLAWCEARTRELGSRVSVLAPAWYLGSFLIGGAAGLAGDRVSLSFLAETERQVMEHLDGHLQQLPGADRRSRAIVSQMRSDESAHHAHAVKRGAEALPPPVRMGMRLTARIMTSLSYYL